MNVCNSLSVQTLVLLQHWLASFTVMDSKFFIYCYGHTLCLQEASWCCSSTQVDFWAKQLQGRLLWWVQKATGSRRAARAGHVCRMDSYFWLTWPGLPLQTAEVLEHESPKLPGPCRASQHCLPRESEWPASTRGGMLWLPLQVCDFCAWHSSWDLGGLSAHRKVGKVSISCGCHNQSSFGEKWSFLLLRGKG